MGKRRFDFVTKKDAHHPNRQVKKTDEGVHKAIHVKKKKPVHETPYALDGETAYAFITGVMGDRRFTVVGMSDGKPYRGKLHMKRPPKKKHVVKDPLALHNLVLISFRNFGNSEMSSEIDIIYRYSSEERALMEKHGELPRGYDNIIKTESQKLLDDGDDFFDRNYVEEKVEEESSSLSEDLSDIWDDI